MTSVCFNLSLFSFRVSRRELEEVKRQRRKQESEIETLENPILKGRFIADLKRIQDEEAAKEAEYQELAAAVGEY